MLLKNLLTYLLTSNYRFILHDIVPRYSDGNREFLCPNLCNVEVKNFGTRLSSDRAGLQLVDNTFICLDTMSYIELQLYRLSYTSRQWHRM